jgi:hypothetical protein
VLAVSLAGAELRSAAAQQPDPAGLLPVKRVLAALRPDLQLGVFRTLASADVMPGRRVAVVAAGQVPRRGEEWFPETWAVVLLDAQVPGRIRVLDTLRAYEVRSAIEYAAPDEVIVRREAVDYGENMFGDQYRQYFMDSLTWAERGRRIYRGVMAASPVAVQESVFTAMSIMPMARADTAYPSLLLAVPTSGGAPRVHQPPLDSIRRLEALGDSLVVVSDERTWMRLPGTGQWVGTGVLDSLVRERRLADSLRLLHPRLPAFRVRGSDSSDTIEEIRLTGTRRITLPAPSWERFARSRPKEVALNSLGPAEWLLHATVGPTAIVGDQLWLGLEFYDGEGMSGVGGLGMLDPSSGRLRVLYPPAMADWSVASLAAEDSVLWLGLASYGEGSTGAGGLARYEIGTGRLVRYDVPGVITGILPVGGALYLTGERGLYVLRRGSAGSDILERLTVRLDRAGAPHVLRTTHPLAERRSMRSVEGSTKGAAKPAPVPTTGGVIVRRGLLRTG